MNASKNEPLKEDFSKILNKKMGDLCLSEKVRSKIVQDLKRQNFYNYKLVSRVSWVIACLVCFAFVIYKTSSVGDIPESFVKIKSVTYSDQNRTNWVKSTILVKSTKNNNSYIKITATKSRNPKTS